MIERSLARVVALCACIAGGSGLAAFATDYPGDSASLAGPGGMVDAALNDRVESTLKTDAGLAGSHLRVTTRGGVVTLAGTVPDEAALRRALEAASNIKGVREVQSSLMVDPVR